MYCGATNKRYEKKVEEMLSDQHTHEKAYQKSHPNI